MRRLIIVPRLTDVDPAKFYVGALCLLCLSAQLLLSQVSESPNRGKQIVDAAVAALGGNTFLQMRSRIASGRVYAFFHDQLSGLDLATIYTEYPDRKPAANGLAVIEREVLGKKQDYSFLFLADQGWDVTFRGARPIPDENWQRYVRTTQNDILYLLHSRPNEPGMDFDYVGSQVYVSRHIEVVDITDSASRTVRVYFDHNTKLPMRQTYNWLDEDTKQRNEEVSVFDKYRDIGNGIMWPFSIERERNGYKTYQFFADKVQANQAIPPKIFELPPGARVLKKVD
ncbi:MAG: hypothetical protein M3Y24_02350 [Acidobacteriota bacterium]|nr:hypothetical protein [Acidobacteriota bacterium]